MPKNCSRRIALVFLVSAVLPVASHDIRAQAPSHPYPTAAPPDQYLIHEKAFEIALARSAAPPSIADQAEVLVLTPGGYATDIKGANGFICLVERSWGKSTDDPEFWNPKVRAPICVNAPAAKTYLPIILMKSRLVMAAKSRMEIGQVLKAARDRKELPPLEPNAMCYMMSKQQYLSDSDKHWHPHMMWFVPGDSVESWGAKGGDVPVYVANVPEDHMTIFMIPVDHWSDGTPTTH